MTQFLLETPCIAPPTAGNTSSINAFIRTYMAPSLTYIAQHAAAACNMLALQASHRRPATHTNVKCKYALKLVWWPLVHRGISGHLAA